MARDNAADLAVRGLPPTTGETLSNCGDGDGAEVVEVVEVAEVEAAEVVVAAAVAVEVQVTEAVEVDADAAVADRVGETEGTAAVGRVEVPAGDAGAFVRGGVREGTAGEGEPELEEEAEPTRTRCGDMCGLTILPGTAGGRRDGTDGDLDDAPSGVELLLLPWLAFARFNRRDAE